MTADDRPARGVSPALLADLLARFGHDAGTACAIDIDPQRTNVYVAERAEDGSTTGRLFIETFDTATGLPLWEETP